MSRRLATAAPSLARILDRIKLGTAMAAMVRITATTISSSMSENPLRPRVALRLADCLVGARMTLPLAIPFAHRRRGGSLRLPPTELTKLLADGRVGRGGVRTARVGADHARLIGVEGPLPGCPNGYWSCLDVVRGSTTGKSERIAALGAAGEDRVNQVRRGGCGWAARTQVRQGGRVAAVGGRIGDASRVQRSQRAHRRGFVRSHLRTQQVGDGDRRDDQNDCHDDQKLNQRKSFLLFIHDKFSIDLYFLRRHARRRGAEGSA